MDPPLKQRNCLSQVVVELQTAIMDSVSLDAAATAVTTAPAAVTAATATPTAPTVPGALVTGQQLGSVQQPAAHDPWGSVSEADDAQGKPSADHPIAAEGSSAEGEQVGGEAASQEGSQQVLQAEGVSNLGRHHPAPRPHAGGAMIKTDALAQALTDLHDKVSGLRPVFVLGHV